MRLAHAAVFVAAFVLLGAACAEEDERRKTAPLDSGREAKSASDPSPDLRALAHGLVPPEALDRPAMTDLSVEECGIQPVFRCVRAYFVTEGKSLDERRLLVRRQARDAGWRIVSERADRGVIIELERGSHFGSYVLEPEGLLLCEEGSRCVAGTMLTVAGPPIPLPQPSPAERSSWTEEKEAFVDEANAICVEMQTRMSAPEAISSALAHGLEELSALQPPVGEEGEVRRILRPLRNLVRSAAALTDDEGEDALPAAVGVGLFARRFNQAASRYGLEACAALG